MSREFERTFWRLIGLGWQTHAAALKVGVSANAGERWFREAGGMPPMPLAAPKGRYLSLAERETIDLCWAEGWGQAEIARELGRHPSTISRELRRNRLLQTPRRRPPAERLRRRPGLLRAAPGPGRRPLLRYRAGPAHAKAEARARRPKPGKLSAHPELRELVQAGLIRRWSPQQISRVLRRAHPDRPELQVSHETIYRSRFVQGPRRCPPLLDRDGVPEHIRAWTSRPVLDVEAELTARLAARAAGPAAPVPDTDLTPPAADLTPPVEAAAVSWRLDAGQAAAVAALAGDRRLVVVEGAAGAGKTTTLAATRQLLAEQGRRLVVVTPTLKAAKVAAAEVGTAAGSAARLAYEYGWRWDDDGAWTRLAVGDTEPVTGRAYTGPGPATRLHAGDLLVIDEAGMADQAATRALLTIADQCQVRVALFGDRHQLPAVGRGGVLDLAVGQVEEAAYLTLTGLHCFVHTDTTGRTTPDTGYADLTLAMRTGDNPGKVFDALLARGRIRLHPDAETLREAVAAVAATSHAGGRPVALVVDTRVQAAELNAAIRDRLVAAGRVHDTMVVTTEAGERIGVGDRIATRRNDRDLDVANRDVWIVTGIGRDGGLRVTPADVTPAGPGPAPVTPTATRQRWLPADYVSAHLELAYATTAHGAQGDTVTAAHLVVGEHTGAASAYVGMTRGREANTAHLIAADLRQAGEQWMVVFARDRADLGPAHAAELAAAEAARYAEPRPLDQVLAELHAAWTDQQRCQDLLARQRLHREALRSTVALHAESTQRLAVLEADCVQTATHTASTRQHAEASGALVAADAGRIRDTLLGRWDADRAGARQAVQTILDGPGRFGFRRGAVARAGEQLTGWYTTWVRHLPGLPADNARLTRLARGDDDRAALKAALKVAARREAERAYPEHAELTAAADAAGRAHYTARQDLAQVRYDHDNRYGRPDQVDYPRRLAEAEQELAATHRELTDVLARIAGLGREPAILAQPPERVDEERQAWRARRDAAQRTARSTARATVGSDRTVPSPRPEDLRHLSPRHTTPRSRRWPTPRGRTG